MTDVLKIALDRRAELSREVARLDDFIRMAEALIRTSQTRSDNELSAPEAAPAPRQPVVERPATVASDENMVRTAMRRADGSELNLSAEVSRPSLIRRGHAAG